MMLTQESLHQLAAALQQGAFLLTPNYRSSDQLTEQLYQAAAAVQNAAQSPFQPRPAILAIDLWLKDLWQQLAQTLSDDLLSWHLLQPAEEQLLWRQVLRKTSPDLLLLNEEGAASEAISASRLLQQWQVPLSELRKHLSFADSKSTADDCETAWHWLQAFERYCHQQHLLTFSGMLQAMLRLLSDNPTTAQRLLPKQLLLWGFDSPPPLYRSLLATFAAAGVKIDTYAATPQKPQVTVQSYPHLAAESQAAARWAQAILQQEPQARIAIICADSDTLKTTVARSFAQEFQDVPGLVTNTLVGKIGDEPYVHTALTVLELVQPEMDTLRLCSLLRSPFLIGQETAEQDARAELELLLRKRGNLITLLVDVRELSAAKGNAEQALRYYSPLLADALLTAQQLQLRHAAKQTLNQWLPHFEQLWELLLPRALLLATGESVVVKSWDKLLKQAQNSSYLLGQLTYHQAINTLRALARATSAASPMRDGAILLLTPVMAAGLHFTHCWFLQMTESCWPLATTPHAYLPLTLQREQQMPGVDANVNLQQSRDLLTSLRERTQDSAYYSYALMNDGQAERASALLPTSTSIQISDASDTHNLLLAAFADKANNTSAVELYDDHVNHPLGAQEVFSGGSKLITEQSACPFRAFATQRLRVRELPKLTYGIPPNAIGDCLHHVLEQFWRQLQNSAALHSSSEADLVQLLTPAIQRALQTLVKRFPTYATPTWFKLEEQRLLKLLLTWIEQEKLRGAFTVIGTEADFFYQTAHLNLRLRIDRIDRQADGTTVIVDYKSGRSKSVNWQEQRPASPQLLLYEAAVNASARYGPTTALLYGNLYVGKTSYSGLSADDNCLATTHFINNKSVTEATWQALVSLWHGLLQQLAQEFAEGYAAVQPMRNNSCDYCTLTSFCRVKELQDISSDDDEELAEDAP